MITSGGTTTLGLYDNASEIRKKADITYVDSIVGDFQVQVASVAGGHKGYLTLALATTASTGLPANTVVEVTNDPTIANNGLYLWNGTTLTKSNYDPLTQSKKYTDEKTKFVKAYRGVNIANLTTATKGSYVDYLNGNIGVNPEYLATDYLEVDGGVEYKTDARYVHQFAFYDANKVFISGLLSPDASKKFTTPSNTRYIRMSVYDAPDYTDGFMVAKASEFPTAYTPYSINLQDLTIGTDQVNGLEDKINEVVHISDLNIVNLETALKDRYVDSTNGLVGSVAEYYATDFLPIKPSTAYRTDDAYIQQFAFYDINKAFIGGQATAVDKKFTTPVNAAYIRLTIPTDQLSTIMITEESLFPSEYVPYDIKVLTGIVLPDQSVKTVEINTSADLNDDSAKFKGKNSVQLALDSITDAAYKKRYVIKTKGLHKVNVASEVIGYPGYPSMILAKDHVDIVGDGKTVFWCELPFNDADIRPSANGITYPRTSYQTLYSYAKDSLIKDVTFVIVNGRYALHLDNPNGANSTHNFEGVNFVSKGSKGSMQALGIGTSTGEETYFTGGSAHSDGGTPFYCHNNSKFSTPSKMYFEGFKFSSNTSKLIMRCENDGSLVDDKMQFVGCSWGGTSYVMEYGQLWLKSNTSQKYDSFNHAEWKFTGYGNEPFLFDNQVAGYCLRLRTTATGLNNTIRFDKNSSAYSTLIQNNQSNTDVSLYTNSRDYIDGYIVQDGSIGLPAQAWGCKDLTESASYADAGVIYTSMGKRLGDCSTSNKTLGVIINGTPNTVTFNKDYRSMTNTQIIAEINTQLSGAIVELYVYGRDYYAEMTDVIETVYNTTDTFIPKGSVVVKSKGSVRLAQAGDKIYGVALDDIPVQRTTVEGLKKGEGRIMKRGYIYADWTKPHFVLSDIHRPALGSKFKVVNGQLVTDANGKISVDTDDAVISINC